MSSRGFGAACKRRVPAVLNYPLLMVIVLKSSRPLRIVHVANFSLKPKGAGFFSVSFKMSNGLTRLGHNVINFSDRDVARASNIFGSRKFGVGAANKKLVELVSRFRPDLLLLGHADVIQPDTLDEIRASRPGIKIVQWSVDALFEPDNVARLKSKIARVDCTFVSTAGARLDELGAPGHKVAYLPNPVDPSIECFRAFEHPRAVLQTDLFFASGSGTVPRFHVGIETTANKLATQIREAVPGLRTDFPGILGAPHKFGAAFEDALATSAMALNLSRRNDDHLYSSDRIAQVMGCGLLTFVDRATGLEEFFSDEEIVFYSDEAALISAIDQHFRDDDLRRRRAEAGWRKYFQLFDTTRVCDYVIDVIFDRVDPATFKWQPTPLR